MNDIFGKELNEGDFVLFNPIKSDIHKSSCGIITPYNTIFFPFLNLDIFLDSNLSNFSGYYKLEKLDVEEQSLYDIILPHYAKRMSAIEFYNNAKSNLPIGSLLGYRDKTNRTSIFLLYLGKYTDYILLKKDTYLNQIYPPFLKFHEEHTHHGRHYFIVLPINIDELDNLLLNNDVKNIRDLSLINYFEIVSYNTLPDDMYLAGNLDMNYLFDKSKNLDSESMYIYSQNYYPTLNYYNYDKDLNLDDYPCLSIDEFSDSINSKIRFNLGTNPSVMLFK